MRHLSLFTGLGGSCRAWRERGHEVIGVEKNPDIAEKAREQGDYEEVLVMDVRDLDADWLLEEYGPFDSADASPPCQTFSVMTISVYHDANGLPDHPLTHERLALVHDTFALLRRLDPDAWFVENPTGMLRRQEFMKRYERRTVTYCQYGHFLRKSTDLWGGFPPNLALKPTCSPGDSCHARSPRELTNQDERPDRGDWDCDAWDAGDLREAWERDGNKLPSDVDRSALRALVPPRLSHTLCTATEDMLDAGRTWRDGTLRQDTLEVTP